MTKKAGSTDWHPADIVAALRKAGWSMRALGIANGYSPSSLKNVMVRSWPKAERIVATAIGVKPEQIWPSRYQKAPSMTDILADHFSDMNVTKSYRISNAVGSSSVMAEV